MYLASTAVVLTELMKFVISVSMIFYNSNCDMRKTGKLIYVEIVEKWHGTLKVSVPSVLYTIQNNLLYVAITHLNAATFQVKDLENGRPKSCYAFCLFSGYLSTEDPHHSTLFCDPAEEESE